MAYGRVPYLIVVLRPKTQDKNLLLWILGDLFNVIPSGLRWDPTHQTHAAVQVISQVVRGARHLRIGLLKESNSQTMRREST